MEKKRFFTGTQIAGIIIFILVGLTCTIGLIMAQIAKASMPIQIVIPASGLSDSIFDAQNSVYEADADFPVEHQFEHLSDVVDVPNRHDGQWYILANYGRFLCLYFRRQTI